MDSATTNLSEITCDFVRLWDAEALQHRDVRELFVHQVSVVSPEAVEVQVGQEIDTELVYPAPTYQQVPSLKGLLEYIEARGTGSVTNKFITNRRKHYTLQEGTMQQVRHELTVQAHRHEHLFVNELHTTLKRGKPPAHTQATDKYKRAPHPPEARAVQYPNLPGYILSVAGG